jgi:hypothetical protein
MIAKRLSTNLIVTALLLLPSAGFLACKKEEAPATQTKSLPTPPRGPLAVSVHVGVKRLSSTHYGRIDPLVAPPTDAQEMQLIARAQGFTSPDAYLLLNENAKAKTLLDLIGNAAATLKSGDTFFLTFSGHGTLLPDKNNDEPSGYDSAWCLYDRALVDDEIDDAFTHFKPGVHIFVVSDSCHSGTVVTLTEKDYKPIVRRDDHSAFRLVSNPATLISRPSLLRGIKQLTDEEFRDVYARNQALYDEIQKRVPGQNRAAISASVALLAACQDDEITEDGSITSAFTTKILKLWNKGLFSGTLRSFYDTLRATADKDRVPNLYFAGANDHVLEGHRPFTPIN